MRRTFVFTCLLVFCFFLHGFCDDFFMINLDDTKDLGLIISSDHEVKSEGKGSLKISTKWPTVVCIGEVKDLTLDNSKLVYKAKVKSDFKGEIFLEMWAFVGGQKYFSKGVKSKIKNSSDWKEIDTPFIFQKDQNPEKIVLNIVVNGEGTLWVDDVVLSKNKI